MKSKGKLFVACTAVLGLGLVMFAPALAHGGGSPPNPGHDPVTFCHATPPDTAANGWNEITTDDDGVLFGHAEEHDADIIPSFQYWVWEQTGTELQTFTYEKSNDFSDSRVSIDFENGDQQVDITGLNGWVVTAFWYDLKGGGTNWVYVGAGDRSNYNPPGPADIDKVKVTVQGTVPVFGWVSRTFPGKNLTTLFGWGATGQQILDNGCVIPEPPYVPCSIVVEQEKQYGPVVDVGNPVWGPWFNNGDGTFTRTGTQATEQNWTQKFVDSRNPELVCRVEEGTILGSRTVKETKEGQVTLTPSNTCEGWSEVHRLFDPDGKPVDEDSDSGLWIDPLAEEEATSKFGTLFSEPAGCYEVDVRYFSTQDCEGWEVFEQTTVDGEDYGEPVLVEQDTWNDPFVLEVASSHGLTIEEPSECLLGRDWDVEILTDCEGWELTFHLAEGGILVLDEGVSLSGTWVDPYTLEAATVSGRILWGEIEEPFSLVVSEPQECYVCELRPLYRMVRLIDRDAPDWYWGTGADNGSCWVIMHEDGTYPSLARQADVCSVCAYPDFVYQADAVAYDAYVMVDCKGRIIYPDPLWRPAWFREDYDSPCRQPSCPPTS